MSKDFSYLSSELVLVRNEKNQDLMRIIDSVNSEEKEKEKEEE